MTKALKIGISMVAILAIIVSCSTEKNTLINRTFHGINARYNGYFNATELMNQSMNSYKDNRKEDYYNILPLNPVPSEQEVVGMYPAIDTAIAKCKKVIQDHSMPSNDRPAYKKDEHNPWIDENWTQIGIASYYRRDYEGAMKSFKFVRKFYSNDPSLYVGELWMAKTNIATGKLTEAKFNLDNLDKAILEQADGIPKPTKKGQEPIAKFPKKIRFDLEKTKAQLALEKGEKDDAIAYLEESLNHTRYASGRDKARVHFILGQLYQEKGNASAAKEHYAKVLKGTSSFEMAFNARLKKTFLSDGEKVKSELKKMLRDAKNAEFRDQIYYALADIELREGNEPKGVEYLTQSAFYSTSNTRQKGMAYERLGDMRFTKRDYVSAQKYYDSCARVITDAYPNAEGIRNKALKLQDLVTAVETAVYEDSVQRIAAMSEGDREDFLKNVIKQIEKEAQEKKEREAQRLLELQANQNLFVQNQGGSKWYWNNAKTRAEGFDEFRRLWGTRENEDDWRRSDKTIVLAFDEGDEPSGSKDSLAVPVKDTLTVELLSRNLPLTDSALALSNERLLEAYYNAGIIYKEQLKEDKLAEEQFMNVLNRNIENRHNLLASYQLYKIYETTNVVSAGVQKQYIFDNYPNSDYANYLRDPDYFVKKKERDALAEQEYVKVLDRYNRGIYSPVLAKADQVISEEKENLYRSKYMLLKALCIGQMNENKQKMVPVLDSLIVAYPSTPEAARAQELLTIIKNGVSKNIEADFSSKYPFVYDDKAPLVVFVMLPPTESSSGAKSRIIDFQREFFSRERLKVDSKIFGETSMVIISEFATEADAQKYITAYKNTRKYLLDLQNADIRMITKENMKILFQKQNLGVYDNFYNEYY